MKKIVLASLLLCAGVPTKLAATPYVNVKRILPAVRIAHNIEKKHGIPENLLTAIAHVESKTSKYAVNAKGRAYFFNTKEEAARFIRSMQDQGVTNFNIGYMQLNYSAHRKRFKSIEDMLELKNNIEYAAKLLKAHYRQTGSWDEAVHLYKSGARESTQKYKNLVYSIWAKVHVPKHLLKDSDEAPLLIKTRGKTYKMTTLTSSPKAVSEAFITKVHGIKAPILRSAAPKA